jgi:hypothetical protein
VAKGAVGTAIVVKAAKLGSAAHRVRAFWTNAAPSKTLYQRYGQFDWEWVHDRKEAKTFSGMGAGSTQRQRTT